MIFDITLCGDWAGATYNSAGYSGTCAERVADPANFESAFIPVLFILGRGQRSQFPSQRQIGVSAPSRYIINTLRYRMISSFCSLVVAVPSLVSSA
jgi:hypothetical protein